MTDRLALVPQQHTNGNGAGSGHARTDAAPTRSSNGSSTERITVAPGALPRIRLRRVRRVSGPFTAIPELRRTSAPE